MNINNFESHINKTILDRGYDYNNEGNIIETYNQRDNEYIFQVQGSEGYEVVVQIDNKGEILNSQCDCPYDFGPICKHQVAAYFELFEILNSEDNSTSVKKEVIKRRCDDLIALAEKYDVPLTPVRDISEAGAVLPAIDILLGGVKGLRDRDS